MNRFVAEADELHAFIEFAWHAVNNVSSEKEFVLSLLELASPPGKRPSDGFVDPVVEPLLPSQRLESFAAEQTRSGFAYLYSLAVVRLWSILEAAVDDSVKSVLLITPTSSLPERLVSLRGPLLSYARATPDQQVELLLELLKDDAKAPLKVGAGRFEAVLAAIDLGGPVDPIVRRVLFELSEMRNVVVHSQSTADRRFVERCSWLSIEEGAPVRISAADFYRYFAATHWYLGEIMRRYVVKHLEEPRKSAFCARLVSAQTAWLGKLSADAEG